MDFFLRVSFFFLRDSLVKKRRVISKREEKKILEEKFELQIFLVREILHHFYEKPEGGNQ